MIIASLRRTGSSMLASALRDTGVLGFPAEYLNPGAILRRRRAWGTPRIGIAGHAQRVAGLARLRREWRVTDRFTPASFSEYLDEIPRRRSTPNGTFAIKVHWDDFERQLLARHLDEQRWGVPVAWVRLTRDDHVRQAVSLVRAQQTGRWDIRGRERRAACYDGTSIGRALAGIEHDHAAWSGYFARRGVEPVEVCYEPLIAEYDTTMRSLLDALGEASVPVPAMPGGQMADDLSDGWVERYRQEVHG